MIVLKDLSIHYGSKLLFDEVNLLLTSGKRYAVVGANGSGKSTLLRMMMDQESPSLGEIQMPKNAKVGWVKQDHFRYENDSVLNVVIQGRKVLWEALEAKEELLCGEWTDAAANRLGVLEDRIAHEGGYEAESIAHTLLSGLGIPDENHEKPLSALSGGYKMRVLLAQALFENPEILLLDEPTNHLDIMTIAWLEEYLMHEFRGLLVLVSHDIGFLNNVATHILDIDYGEIREYPGNYKNFLVKKQEMMLQKLKETQYLEDKVAHLQSFVDRFGAKASKAKQAKAREKMIEKIELPDVKKSSRLSPHFAFVPSRPSGKQVLTVDNIAKTFGEKQVLNKIKLEIKRGEKVAIIGHNGIGKSTLLKIMLDLLPPDTGSVTWGHEVNTAYFAQDHHEMLKQSMSVLDWLTHEASSASSSKVRNMLGQVLFTQDEAEKNILNISGGEAGRLLLANLMLAQPNVLVLDEPTNHLDIETIEALAKALKAYTGTLILVSHDRYFMSKIATRILAFTEEGMKDFQGTYSEYLRHYKADFLSRSFLAAHEKKNEKKK